MRIPILVAFLVGFAAADGAEAQHDHGRLAPAPMRTGRIGAVRGHQGPLPPLPRVPFEPARPRAVVQQVYEFAARHPEVLSYVPCYCGCERIGHGGNHDCFVKSRSAEGRVVEWDAHGLGCTVCLDVARDAMLMHHSGASASAIRTAIDRKYAGHFPSATPTPRPPAVVR